MTIQTMSAVEFRNGQVILAVTILALVCRGLMKLWILLLLERVFLRVGSADTDEQLENAVSKFLPPVLLKLSSPNEAVRNKVMDLLAHVNKRVKNRSTIQLPVEALLVQYQDPAASAFITNFTIIYIRLGFPRLAHDKQAQLLPTLIHATNRKPVQHQERRV
ncbi:hypothetical protein AAG570_005025 [Ranatra chinensis]|uniref:Proteasome component Ecm29 N-terminal domain-containing protein n=1 Tax=Ranatra chinensis TaxID=642074 RepID=A0ABD0YC15_9HEMI